MQFEHAPGATPLDAEEAQALIPTHIVTMDELNEWEQHNILEAENWLFRRKHRDVLTEAFVRRLHREMFGHTWAWAGTYRVTGKNLGVPAHLIIASVKKTCDDARYWMDERVFQLDETAARLHHRMVSVHPFPNGNGRHTRLMADALLALYDAPRFTWGRSSLQRDGETRTAYLQALRAADEGRYTDLITFARS